MSLTNLKIRATQTLRQILVGNGGLNIKQLDYVAALKYFCGLKLRLHVRFVIAKTQLTAT